MLKGIADKISFAETKSANVRGDSVGMKRSPVGRETRVNLSYFFFKNTSARIESALCGHNSPCGGIAFEKSFVVVQNQQRAFGLCLTGDCGRCASPFFSVAPRLANGGFPFSPKTCPHFIFLESILQVSCTSDFSFWTSPLPLVRLALVRYSFPVGKFHFCH